MPTITESTTQTAPSQPVTAAHSSQSKLPELDEREREAMEYVRDIKGFYSHAIQYAVVITGLLIINLFTNPDYLWVVWPALGWGIGVAIHGLNVFELVNFLGDNWERKQIKKRLNR